MPEPSGLNRRIDVAPHGIIVRGLEIQRQAIADYLREIPANKCETAFIHAVELGVAELTARKSA